MKKTKKRSFGDLGEDLAWDFLQKEGYQILARNYMRPWGEIDIIARSPNRTIVFVEVKTMLLTGENTLSPEDNVTSAKLKKMRKACEVFLSQNGEVLDENFGWRMDLVAIEIPSGVSVEELTKINKNVVIRHYENI